LYPSLSRRPDLPELNAGELRFPLLHKSEERISNIEQGISNVEGKPELEAAWMDKSATSGGEKAAS
jgi:hypothetical protein